MHASNMTQLQQHHGQAGCRHKCSSTTVPTSGFTRFSSLAEQSTLPSQTRLRPAASFFAACRTPRRSIQAAAASNSKPIKAVSSTADDTLALAFLGDAIWSVSSSCIGQLCAGATRLPATMAAAAAAVSHRAASAAAALQSATQFFSSTHVLLRLPLAFAAAC